MKKEIFIAIIHDCGVKRNHPRSIKVKKISGKTETQAFLHVEENLMNNSTQEMLLSREEAKRLFLQLKSIL